LREILERHRGEVALKTAHLEDVTCMKVQIYSKEDCSLCEEAKAVLLAVQRRVPFELEEIDIEKDPSLFAQYRYDIPVVFVDGQKAFKHRLDERAVEARLRRGMGVAHPLPDDG
jgi:glutaredoxin